MRCRTHDYVRYVQFNIAFPLTFGEVFCKLLLTVICRSAGAVAVIVDNPGATHVANPVSSMVAAAVFDDFHFTPSATLTFHTRRQATRAHPAAICRIDWIEKSGLETHTTPFLECLIEIVRCSNASVCL